MPIIVQKYGGTSVGTTERIQAVADRVVRAKEDGFDVLVVVSAMGDHTDELLAMAKSITDLPEPRELDMLLTAGERIAMSLLAIAINARGCKAASYTGSQAGVITDTQHGAAKIVEIRPKRIMDAIQAGNVVILAGFQGLSTDYEITTLGRGASDTTAVAMAAALGADVCEIYTDVEGVYTADPRIVPEARRLETVSYEEMLELAASGAKVLASRSVEYARRHGVRLHVRSSFQDTPGTWIQEVDETQMEGVLISGVALDDDEAKVTLDRVPDKPGVAATVFKAIASEGISVDMIVQNVSHEGRNGPVVHRAARRRPPAGVRDGSRGQGGRRHHVLDRRRHLEGVVGGRRYEGPPRRGRGPVRCSCERRHQHRDDLDIAHPDLLRDPQGGRRTRGSVHPRAVRSGPRTGRARPT